MEFDFDFELVSDALGQLCSNEEVNINLSTEWSMLIKEAASCTAFASDLLYDWESFREKLKVFAQEPDEGFETWFGFRDYGVDHLPFIETRWGEYRAYMRAINESRVRGSFSVPVCPYRSIWKLEIKRDPKYHTWVRAYLYKAKLESDLGFEIEKESAKDE